MKIFLTIVIVLSVFGLKAQGQNDEIQLIYFHMTRRCATCLAVEEEARNTLVLNFNQEYTNGKIKLISINIEENENPELIKKWNAKGQSLLIVKGNKKVDLTSKAFLYARTKPDKYRDEITKAIQNI